MKFLLLMCLTFLLCQGCSLTTFTSRLGDGVLDVSVGIDTDKVKDKIPFVNDDK